MLQRVNRPGWARAAVFAVILGLSGLAPAMARSVDQAGHRCRCPSVKHECHCAHCRDAELAARPAAPDQAEDLSLPPCHRATAARREAKHLPPAVPTRLPRFTSGCDQSSPESAPPPTAERYLLPTQPVARYAFTAGRPDAPRAGRFDRALRPPVPPPRSDSTQLA